MRLGETLGAAYIWLKIKAHSRAGVVTTTCVAIKVAILVKYIHMFIDCNIPITKAYWYKYNRGYNR